MPATPVFSRLDTVVVRVADRVAAVEWYRTKLGFQVLFQDEAAGIAVLHLGRDATLTLWQLREGEVTPPRELAGSFPVFEAKDAAAERAELIARGVDASELRTVARVKLFSFRDLDGNRLEACEVVELDGF
jgi:catechol 2,3-dioxygenase-like lactoylglutathione lyase family enzyme